MALGVVKCAEYAVDDLGDVWHRSVEQSHIVQRVPFWLLAQLR